MAEGASRAGAEEGEQSIEPAVVEEAGEQTNRQGATVMAAAGTGAG